MKEIGKRSILEHVYVYADVGVMLYFLGVRECCFVRVGLGLVIMLVLPTHLHSHLFF